ncbi:O-antigen ligase family protein [Acidobacteriota bacterium]
MASILRSVTPLKRVPIQRGTLPTILLFFVFTTIYAFLLKWYGPIPAAGGMLILFMFCATLIYIEVGLVGLIFSMLFSPEISLGQVAVRAITLRFEDFLILVVFFAWMIRLAIRKEERRFRPANIYLPIAVFLLIGLISTIRGASLGLIDLPSGLMYFFKIFEFFMIFVFTFQYIDNLKKVKILFILMLFTALCLSLWNILLVPTTEVWTISRITTPFEGASPEPSTYGGFFTIVLGLTAALIYHAPTRRIRIWLFVFFGIMFIPFMYTLSRTSYVSFLAVVLALIIMKRNYKLLAVVLIVLVLSPVIFPEKVFDRIMYTFTDRIKAFGIFDRSFGERLFVWRKVWWNLIHRPILGGGLTKDSIIDGYYARILIETGLSGFAAFWWLMISIFRTASRTYKAMTIWWTQGLLLGFILGVIGLLVHAFSAITFYIVRIMEPFWFCTGMIYAISYLVAVDASSNEQNIQTETVSAEDTVPV